MARIWSRGSGVGFCLDSEVRNGEREMVGVRADGIVPSGVWVLRIASGVHVGVLLCLWPMLAGSGAIAVLAGTTFLVLAVSFLLRPEFSQRQDAPSLSEVAGRPRAMRRNKAPVRAEVAPIAAPGAVLARDLDPNARALADLMARISHDLRTPLNAVIGFADLMKQEAFGPLGSPRYQEYAQHIQDCGSALLRSTEDTLAMTSALADVRSNTSSAQAIRLETLVRETVEVLSTRALEQDITLRVDIAPGLEVHGEALYLRQVVLNLMCEALSKVPAGGDVLFAASSEGGRVDVEISSSSCNSGELAGDSLAVCVARVLLHLHGAPLRIMHDENGGWRAMTGLERARQRDLFIAGRQIVDCANAKSSADARAA